MTFPKLTTGERALLTHVTHFGSAGYPVRKLGRQWALDLDAYGMHHPGVWHTKREAVAACEALLDAIRERYAAEARS